MSRRARHRSADGRAPARSSEPPRAASTWCWAPSTALYFEPEGSVRPCCAGQFPIGWVTGPLRRPLREIWEGVPAQMVRDAVAGDDLSVGCAECALSSAAGGRDAALAREFDRWSDVGSTWPVDLEFALSNTCNLQCVMCNGDLSSAIRSRREHRPAMPSAYDDRFFDELDEFLPHARRVAFKGGEPFLALEARRVMDRLLELGSTAEIKVTTNGTLWNDRIEMLAEALRISPIISIDAMDPEVLERTRVGVDAAELWANVDRFQAAADRVGQQLTFSYCLMPSTWQELAPLLAEADRRGAYVTVAEVNQPAAHSLLDRSPEELAAVDAAMAEQEVGLELTDPALRQVWSSARTWVRFCIDRASDPGGRSGSEVVVELRATPEPPSAPVLPDLAASRAAADLASWSGATEVVVDAPGGVVAEVVLPSWASWWDVGAFEGRATVDLLEVLRTQLGGAELAVQLVVEQPGVTVLVLSDRRRGVVCQGVLLRAGGHERCHLWFDPEARSRPAPIPPG